ncbi:MAG: SGNH/GDSL hydrolase family protein [Roseovarius sp.]|jgi:GDSL-like Lipase/Acylhydrolase family|uniref:SGNH/GDSL hydrolase family protein n=1 Tax=Sulfitobacter sp. OXR-159 TaxID=3100174 RepID=UPI002AC8D58E|nr:SGNH/GDSL hydrolase family protein [Sulfitobacter sp. OXR-159]WPZ29684.1 SGNH/GDSL hydrolase family protein [Sulfitobacter sp. OXR-159]
MRRILAVLLIVTGLSACTDTAPRGGGDILVLGDSIVAWNGGRSIPDVIANQTGRSVTSRAVPGAQFDNGSTIASAVGFDIQQQFPGGRWNWVVVNGGANDLSADCGCGACGASVNALIAPDGQSGSIPAFLQRLRAQTGAQVMWMGYYAGSGSGSFAGCRDDLVEIESRIATFAAGRPGIHFVDSEDVIDRGDRGLFAGDNVHPSARGSARIGAYLAQEITARENRSQNPADGL